MEDYRDVAAAVFFLGFGVWLFFFGFNRLRRKRLIENMPTSTIRGLAMGLAEICGKAGIETPFKSPFTKTDCVLYMYKIEEYKRSGKSGHWHTIASGDSFLRPFLLADGTGKAMVFPKGAEVIIPVDYQFATGLFQEIPGALTEFMDSNKISYKSLFGRRTLRFNEWFIKEGEQVYVLGSAKSPTGAPSKEPVDAVIARGDVETTFMISDHSEKELTSKLAWHCFLGIYGGTALSLAMLAYMLFRFNIVAF